MAETNETPLVSEEHLNLSLIAPAARKLTLSVRLDGEQRNSDAEYRIRGRLDTDRMVTYLQLETAINEALKAPDDEGGRMLVAALTDANEAIRELLLDLNAPDTVPERLHLDEQQTLMLLAWISGDVTVADAIANTITAGVSKALTEEELAAARADGDAGASRADSDAPFPSK